jgi:hypothetical protein
MIQFRKIFVVALAGFLGVAYAELPRQLVTHNLTNVWSNAYINNQFATDRHATPPHQTKGVPWIEVLMACKQYLINGVCWATVKMDTKGSPVELCKVGLNMTTGELTPESRCAGNNGYSFTVDGKGVATLRAL